jgi:hypothetical protein
MITVAVVLPTRAPAQAKRYALQSVDGLLLHNVVARAVTHQGKKGVELTVDTTAARQAAAPGQPDPEFIALVKGLTFSNGTIEVEVAGKPAFGADTSARGFVGVAFRVQNDQSTYDAFYIRPTNGRATDQERRNHATQYISHPDWTWFRLRRETPSRYESYVDLVPDAWTKLRIEVRGTQARLYVRDQAQPSLVVNDVKSGPTAEGGVALWIGPGTSGHFRNLTVTPASR